jgi:hypothetical protein
MLNDQLTDLLAQSPVSHNWAARVLEDELYRPPRLAVGTRAWFSIAARSSEPVGAQRYRCPVDDQIHFLCAIRSPCQSRFFQYRLTKTDALSSAILKSSQIICSG